MSIPIPATNPIATPTVQSDTLDRWAIESFHLVVDRVTERRDVTVRMVRSSATKRSSDPTHLVEFRVADLLAEASQNQTLLGIVAQVEPLLLQAAKVLMDARGLS